MKTELMREDAVGMTVNERLFHAGLIDDFDKSIEEQDKAKLILILEKVFLTQDNIGVIVKKYIKD